MMKHEIFKDVADREHLEQLKQAWRDCIEREVISRQAIANLAERIKELDDCIHDAQLRSIVAVPITATVQEIGEHAKRKRYAIDEMESLKDAKTELLKQLAKMESEYRGFSLEKSGIRESMFRLFFNDLLQKHKPLFARIAALGMQLGLTEGMIAGEMFYNCNDDLNDLIHELGILS